MFKSVGSLAKMTISQSCWCMSVSSKEAGALFYGKVRCFLSLIKSEARLGKLRLNKLFLKMYIKLQMGIQMFNKSFMNNFAFQSDLYIFFPFSRLSPNPFYLQLPADLTKMHLTDNPHPQVTHVPSSQSGCSIASDSGSSSLSDIYQVILLLFLIFSSLVLNVA